MLVVLIELGVAPLLAAFSTLAARRYGPRAGGVVSAFPAIVGPVLLIGALEHGTAFAARAANSTLLGLAALSGFAVGYGRMALAGGWLPSLAAGWTLAAAAALLAGLCIGGAGAPAGLLTAVVSLTAAARSLPRPAESTALAPRREESRAGIPIRMAATALLVTVLAAAASALGPVVGGMLAALPVLASVLVVFTHRETDGASAVALLAGMLRGMAGFVAFCEVLALLIRQTGIAPALAAATATALLAQTAIVSAPIKLQRPV
jgi:uncharacterized membrane protein (GlpM family)